MAKWKLNANKTGRHPIVVTLLLVYVFSGILVLTGVINSGAVSTVVPLQFAKLWAVLWTVGALIKLWALFITKEAIASLELESFGIACLSVSTIAYGLTILSANDLSRGGVAALQALGLGLAWTIRLITIRIELRKARRKAINWLEATKDELT